MTANTLIREEAENLKALTEFVMDNNDLVKLEGRLSRFNIFHVLGAARNELRHSNMLAWLFDPEESHGLGDLFLRRWLMHVLHDAATQSAGFQSANGADKKLPSPIEVDVVDFEFVEVTRERAGIDVLVVMQTGEGATWVLCIENKVESLQHDGQLLKYREYVEEKYPTAERAFFVFLTKNAEEPEDTAWVPTSYNEVRDVLDGCVVQREKSIGDEPRHLLKQYLDLLSEDFVDETESAALARKIYQRHKKAIDFIVDSLDDPLSLGTEALESAIIAKAAELNILMAPCRKGLIRFLPKEWDLPQNSGGTAWGPNSRYVVCEITLWPRIVELHVTLGKAPEAWADKVWARAASAPFARESKQRPKHWVKIHKARSTFKKVDFQDADDEFWGQIVEWVQSEVQKPAFKQGVEVMRQLLVELQAE